MNIYYMPCYLISLQTRKPKGKDQTYIYALGRRTFDLIRKQIIYIHVLYTVIMYSMFQ